MPVKKCSNGKWKIGNGKCMYTSSEKAQRAYRAYLAKNPGADEAEVLENGLPEEYEDELLEQQQDSMVTTRRSFLRSRKRNG